MKLSNYVISLQQQGLCYFTTQQALNTLQVSKKALHMSILRLRKKNVLVTIHKDFHLIIRPEYHVLGCLPPEYFIDFLMKHIDAPYYVCLLSAAMFHGAAHQKPQVFQVMTPKRINPIKRGKIHINFIYKKSIEDIPTQDLKVETGYIKISTPGVTAMDMLLYPRHAGGINNITTVLTELTELIDPNELTLLAENSKTNAWVQKLGFLLDKIESGETLNRIECIKKLEEYIHKQNPSFVPLSGGNITGFPRNKNWKIIENITVESEA